MHYCDSNQQSPQMGGSHSPFSVSVSRSSRTIKSLRDQYVNTHVGDLHVLMVRLINTRSLNNLLSSWGTHRRGRTMPRWSQNVTKSLTLIHVYDLWLTPHSPCLGIDLFAQYIRTSFYIFVETENKYKKRNHRHLKNYIFSPRSN